MKVDLHENLKNNPNLYRTSSVKNRKYSTTQLCVQNNDVPNNGQDQVAFKGRKTLPDDVIKALNKNSKWWARFLNYAGANQGEVLNILVTAIGTAVICPLFITYNPFAKEDKDTRRYSAWRQPISALIAVITQLTITKWYNNKISMLASTSNKDGKANFTRADLRACPDDKYLKRIIKLEHPEYNNDQLKAAVKERKTTIEKQAILAKRIEFKDKNIEMKDMLCQDYLDKTKDSLYAQLIKENEAEIKQHFGKSDIDDISTTKLNKFLESKLAQKAQQEGTDTATLIRQTAEKNMKKEILGETVRKSYMRSLKKDQHKTVQEAIDMCTTENLKQYIEKCMNEADDVLKNEFNGLNAETIAKDASEKLKEVADYESKQKLKEFTSLSDLGNSFKETLQNIKIKKMVQAQIKDAKKVYTTQKNQIGLIVTLLTLPISCGILNWVYPRIMEKIMPEMAAKKNQTPQVVTQKGGDK